MRINADDDEDLRRRVTVYLNGIKESHAVEVYVPGDLLEGEGYVVRGVTKDGKQVATVTVPKLLPGQVDRHGALCEKVYGHIKVEIDNE